MLDARRQADAIKALQPNNTRHAVGFGTIESVDVATGSVKVKIQPLGYLSSPMRYLGFGMTTGSWVAYYPPAKGMEVLLLATDVDCSAYVAIGGLFNQINPPPTGAPEGTVLFEHPATGNKVFLAADGKVFLGDNSGAQPFVLASLLTKYDDLVAKYNTLVAYLSAMTLPVVGATAGPPVGLPAGAASPSDSGDATIKSEGA